MARGKQREEAILDATVELLGTHGYDAMTMDAVAERARASKATMYRRWRNKAALVKAALDALDEQHPTSVPDTGTLRSDLVAVMNALRAKATSSYVSMMQSVALAARHDRSLANALRAHVKDEQLSPFEAVLRRNLARRRLPVGAPIDLVHDVAEAMILRQLQLGSSFDRAFIARVVDRVLLPLLHQTPTPGGRP